MRRLLFLRPLPSSAAEKSDSEDRSDSNTDSDSEQEENRPPAKIEIADWKKKRREREQRIQREEEERREQEARDRRRQRELEDSHGSGKKRKKKQPVLESEDEDSYKTVPSSEEHLHSQKHQRVSNHPSMTNTKKKTKKSGAATGKSNKQLWNGKSKVEDSETETTDVSTLGSIAVSESKKKEARKEVLREKIEKWQNDLTEYSLKKKKKKDNVLAARFSECSRKFLFKVTKFTHDNLINEHIDWIIEHLDPSELQDFAEFPQLQDKAMDLFRKMFSDEVRTGLNTANNNKRGDFIKFFKEMPEDNFNPTKLPLTGKAVEDLIFRRGMGAKDEFPIVRTAEWAALIDEVVPEVRDL